MVEAGFSQLILNGLNNSAIQMFPVQLPENWISATNTKALAYKSILSTPLYTLEGQDALTDWQVQVDCFGYTMADAISLARSVDGVLRGTWSGVLPDPDNTVVNAIFRLPGCTDFFNDAARTYVRVLEYSVHYYQQ